MFRIFAYPLIFVLAVAILMWAVIVWGTIFFLVYDYWL